MHSIVERDKEITPEEKTTTLKYREPNTNKVTVIPLSYNRATYFKMMKEESADIENPPTTSAVVKPKNYHNNTPSSDPNKKLKLALVSTFLLVVVVLATVLGISFQGRSNANSGASSSSSNNNDDKDVEEKGELFTNNNTAVTLISTSTVSIMEQSAESTPSSSSITVESTYLVSPGPIEARIRMAGPNTADGYTSCADLKDDILNALKHLANTIIVEQSKNAMWYADEANCIDNDSVVFGVGAPPLIAASTSNEAMAADTMDTGTDSSKYTEDSYEANNQVEGVDEADFVKSDGTHVFAAYGDVLFAWDAQDVKHGLSITKMPYNNTAVIDCLNPIPVDVKEVHKAAQTAAASGSGRKAKSMAMDMMMPIPCYNPKPQIRSLLLYGSRLTVIVSEQPHSYMPYAAETSMPTFWDYEQLTIKVYDAENVPLDGSPLTLLGEKKLQGNYQDARSIDNNGIVITTSHVNTDSFTNDLYRYGPQYCGLNSTEYEVLAKETALNKTESFVDKLMADLELELNGNCGGIFQVASNQAGDTKEVHDSNLLGTKNINLSLVEFA
jgi:hypothetical protein